MPGLNNDMGSIQVEADIAAIKHPVFPPYSGGNEVTWITLLNGRQLAQRVSHVEIRWRAFEIQRRCEADGWHLESQTTLLPEQPGVLVSVTVTNRLDRSRPLSLGFLCSGRAMNTGNEGYSWSVPSIPTDVFSFTKNKFLGQTVGDAGIPDAVCLTSECGNAHSVHVASPAPARWDRERVPTWETNLAAGKSLTITLFASFHAERDKAVQIARQWLGRSEEVFVQAQGQWEALWQAAFTPGNRIFSGHMPLLESPNMAMKKLYYNGILTLLTCRRIYEHSPTKPSYLTLWPRRGEGSAYLAWELNCTSGILARLDPAALRSHWLLLASAPWLNYQMTNYFSGEHSGWACCAQPQSLYTGALNLLRWNGDKTWMTERIRLLATDSSDAPSEEESGFEIFLRAVAVHRKHHLPDKVVVDFGGRGAYLECITTYAHGTAGHTALQAWALREAASLFPEDNTLEITALENAALDLYREGAGYFDCEYPDGTRRPAANLYDLGLVLAHSNGRLPTKMVREIVTFARRDLLTPTWAHCLWPGDLDSLSGIRCDHQWAGCFPAWLPQFVLGLLRNGERGDWIAEWLEGVSQVVNQGPFAQAYWAEDLYPPEAGAAAKCHDELTQGNHWVIGSGTLFAEMILDGICGLQAGVDGTLALRAGLDAWSRDASLSNIAIRGKSFELKNGILSFQRNSSEIKASTTKHEHPYPLAAREHHSHCI
ncbi:hypothetical protein BH09VER1_BH09VER1_55200 [soil metagenome]